MDIAKELEKAKIDCGISSDKELAEKSGVSVEKVRRIMKNETSSKTVDVVSVARCLGLKLKFIALGED